MKGTEGSKIILELKPNHHDLIVPKRFYGSLDSTYRDTSLNESYDGNGVTMWIITAL
jgi:hypothetical protein